MTGLTEVEMLRSSLRVRDGIKWALSENDSTIIRLLIPHIHALMLDREDYDNKGDDLDDLTRLLNTQLNLPSPGIPKELVSQTLNVLIKEGQVRIRPGKDFGQFYQLTQAPSFTAVLTSPA